MAMRVLRGVALCALTLSPWAHAQASSATASPFYPDAESSLLSVLTAEETTAPKLDRAWIWQRYESHLLSKTRSAAFLVLFTSENDCGLIVNDVEDEDEDEGVAQAEIEQRVQECRQENERIETVVDATQTALSQQRDGGLTTVVRIDKSLLPHAFEYHRVSSSPLLLWLPPRSSKVFQRYPHVTTNSLDLSASSNVADLPFAISTFFQRQSKQSAAFVKTAQLAFEGSSAETIINALPFLAIGLYILSLAFEHRAAVLKVVQSRLTWLVITEGIVYVSLSGLFHSIIHKTPPFIAHPQHGLYFIHPSGRKQFFLEGLVNGSWSFWISFGLFSIIDVLPKIRSTYAREELFQYALLLIGIAYILLHLIFTAKHRWLTA